jgi:hypothetical protein
MLLIVMKLEVGTNGFLKFKIEVNLAAPGKSELL